MLSLFSMAYTYSEPMKLYSSPYSVDRISYIVNNVSIKSVILYFDILGY